MTRFRQGLLAALGICALVFIAGPTQAATLLGTYEHAYGSDPGRVDPAGNDVLGGTSMTVSDQSTGRFSDSFDFSGLAYTSIDSFSLTLSFGRANDAVCFFLCLPTEIWTVRVIGQSNGSADDQFERLTTAIQPQTFVTSATTDTGGITAFAQALASKRYEFWFSELTGGADSFILNSARLDVYGTAPIAAVPLPAGGAMLLGGLGVLALARRRRAA